MFRWVIHTGVLYDASLKVVAKGYAGKGEHKNNPNSIKLVGLGPLPPGLYHIKAPRDSRKVGPYALPLEPVETNQMYGRSAFLIHGESIKHPGTASNGCIIPGGGRATREKIWASGDRMLEVVL